MSATTRSTHVPVDRFSVNLPRVLRSESIKLVTLRSTWWSIVITAAITIGIALLMAGTVTDHSAPLTLIQSGGIAAVVSPVQFAALLAGILGVISVTGEYSTGMIRSTFMADPLRGRVLVGKVLVAGAAMFFASLAFFMTAAAVVSPLLAAHRGHSLALDWGNPSKTLFPLIAAALSMAACSMIGVSFGFMIRSGAGAIAAIVALLFILPVVASFFIGAGESWKWLLDMMNFLPLAAAQFAILPVKDAPVSVPQAYLVLGVWVVGGLLGAWATVRARDV